LGSLSGSAHGKVSLLDVSQRRTIVNKAYLKLPENFPEPWPYREKGYHHIFHMYTDRTYKRFHKNSKLIVLEGNIGAGKSTMGPELADSLGFHWMPEFTMDDILIDRYGNDLRHFYHLFPKRFRIPDINMFYKDPNSDQTATMQDRIYFCRFEQYMNALAHIFNTGQGVVLERSVYSEFVFTNAMRKKNFISPEYFRFYYYFRKMSLPYLRLWPHLVIYLDCPVEKCLENIKKRGNSAERDVVDAEYLQTIENSYKDSLKELKNHSELLIYDWTTPGDTDTIVEDIEQIDFEFFQRHLGDVWAEWFRISEEWWGSIFRTYITEKREPLMRIMEKLRVHEVSELYIDPLDAEHFTAVMKHEVLKSRCSYGYTDKDPISSTGIFKLNQVTPERWTEYFYKEQAYSSLHTVANNFDPLAKNYNPDFLHHK